MNKGELKYVIGDVTNPQRSNPDEVVIIPHCCNNSKVMGAGVALALRKKWPDVYEVYNNQGMDLGETSFCIVEAKDDKIKTIVVNMIGQDGTVSPDNPRPVKYWALTKAMITISNFCKDSKKVIHCPRFGSDLAGGDWNIIEALIKEIWIDSGIDVVVYNFVPKDHKPLSLYKTTITIWSEDHPKQCYESMEQLVREAEKGDAYCSSSTVDSVSDVSIDSPKLYQGINSFFRPPEEDL